MLKPNGSAKPILRWNAIVIGAAFLMQRALLAANGPTHAATMIYVWALGGLLGAAIMSLVLLKLDRPAIATHLWGISSLIAVAAMSYGHMESGADALPDLRLLVPLGLPCISLALGWRVGKWYALAASALLIGLAVKYGSMSDGIMAVAILTLSVVQAQVGGKVALKAQDAEDEAKEAKAEVTRLEGDFNNLQEAIEAFTGNGETGQEAEGNGGGADRAASGRAGAPRERAGA